MHHVKTKQKNPLLPKCKQAQAYNTQIKKKGVKTIRVSSNFAPDAALIEKK